MVIVQIQGGLGNQLFGYCLYKKFKLNGTESYADLTLYKNIRNKTAYNLNLLNLTLDEFQYTKKQLSYLCGMSFAQRVSRKLGFKPEFPYKDYREKEFGKYEERIFNLDDVRLLGYFQSEKYFSDIKTQIRDEIQFIGADCEMIKKKQKEINEKNSVSIHVRLGDYLNSQNLYGGICTKEYYEKAISYIKVRVPDPVFYVFSNDMHDAMDILAGCDVECRPICTNGYKDAHLDMFLMSCCKHHIIANSSFSWWGAWLNSNTNKIIIAPKRWLNGFETPDIAYENWVRM